MSHEYKSSKTGKKGGLWHLKWYLSLCFPLPFTVGHLPITFPRGNAMQALLPKINCQARNSTMALFAFLMILGATQYFCNFFLYWIKKLNPRMHTALSTSGVSYVEFCIRIKYYPPSMTAIIFFIKAAVTAHKKTSRCSLLIFPRRRSEYRGCYTLI